MGFLKSTLSSLRKGLARTRDALGGGILGVLRGKRLSDEVIDTIEARLIRADVGIGATNEIIQELRTLYRSGQVERGEEALALLQRRLTERFSDAERSIARATAGPTVILVAGVNGTGKTTSVAKIAKSLRDEGRTVLLAAADTFRAGAVAQLETWASRLNVDIVRGTAGADPASVAFDAADAALARNVDVLLIDTAGRLHTEKNLMRQLTKIRDVVAKKIPGAPHEVLLVLDATAGQNALNQAREFRAAIDVTGVFLAKLDGTARGGMVIAINDVMDIPVKLIGIGELPEDVAPFEPEEFVNALLDDESDR